MKTFFGKRFPAACLGLLVSTLISNTALGQLSSIGITEVDASPAIISSAAAAGTTNSLQRVKQSLDQQLIPAIQGTRKFEIKARGDLGRLFEEAGATGNAFMIPEVDYVVVTTVDDFQDYTETATFEGLGESAVKRVIRLSAVGKIYDSQKGTLLETATFQLNNRDVRDLPGYSTSSGTLSDSLLTEMARMMAEKIANRVVDVIFPAKVLAVTGPQVTLNRGDSTAIEVGQVWKIYALGEALVDPDTGVVLGQDEIEVGSIRITQVLPKFSKGQIIENYGIQTGNVLRPAQ